MYLHFSGKTCVVSGRKIYSGTFHLARDAFASAFFKYGRVRYTDDVMLSVFAFYTGYFFGYFFRRNFYAFVRHARAAIVFSVSVKTVIVVQSPPSYGERFRKTEVKASVPAP